MDRQQLLDASVLCSRSLRTAIKSVDGTDGRPRSLLLKDFSFAAGGLMRIGEYQAVRDTLDALLPRLLESPSPFTRFARSLIGLTSPNDANAPLVWTACRYAQETDQPAWFALTLPKLERGLASASPTASSNFMAQLQYWKALFSFSERLLWLGRKTEAASRRSEAASLARRIDTAFWDETRGFYQDSSDNANLSPGPNLAAAAWGLAPEDRAARIVRAIDRAGLWSEIVVNELWIAAIGLRVLKKTDQTALLTRTFSKILSKIEKGTPSSGDAGMLLEAFHELLTTDEVSCDSR